MSDTTRSETGPAEPLPWSATFPAEALLPSDTVSYGPDVATEATLRLLGNVDGKRILELGSGAGQAAVALAKQGAHVISVDPTAHRHELVRTAAEREEVRVELHQSDLAELAFVRADTVDAVVSIYALAGVEDLDRVFRQVHRVLRTECHLLLSLPHPAFTMLDLASGLPAGVGRGYFDRSPRPWTHGDQAGTEYPRTIGDVFTSLSRANFRVDTLLEPEPEGRPHSSYWVETMSWVPATLIIRARKEGT